MRAANSREARPIQANQNELTEEREWGSVVAPHAMGPPPNQLAHAYAYGKGQFREADLKDLFGRMGISDASTGYAIWKLENAGQIIQISKGLYEYVDPMAPSQRPPGLRRKPAHEAKLP